MRRRATILGLTVLAVLAFGTIGVSNASAWHFFRCELSGGNGHFKSGNCTKDETDATNKSAWELYTIETNFTGTVLKKQGVFILNGVVAGVKFEFECSEEEGAGTFSSPTGIGVIEELEIDLSSCTVPVPSLQHCSVQEGTIPSTSLSGLVVGTSEAAVELSPASGTTIATVTLEGCKLEALDGTYSVEGSAVGTVEGETPYLIFDEASGSSLELAGNPATLEGEAEMSGKEEGGAIVVR